MYAAALKNLLARTIRDDIKKQVEGALWILQDDDEQTQQRAQSRVASEYLN